MNEISGLTGMISIPLPVHGSTGSMVDNTMKLIIVNVVTHFLWRLLLLVVAHPHPVLLVSLVMIIDIFWNCFIGPILMSVCLMLPLNLACSSVSTFAVVLSLLPHLLQ